MEVVHEADAIVADGGRRRARRRRPVPRQRPARPAGPHRHARRHADRRQPARARARGWSPDPAGPRGARRASRYLEFGAPDDGGEGAAAIAAILDGRRTGAISIAREWELEGGVPGIGTRLPVRDHTGREHGAVIVRRVSIVPLGQIDEHAVAALGTGETVEEFRRWACAALERQPRDDGLPARATRTGG